MVRFSAAESSLTVYSGRLARTGAAAWTGVPVIAAHDTRPGRHGEIGAAAAGPPSPRVLQVSPSRKIAATLSSRARRRCRGAEIRAKNRPDVPRETYTSRPEWTIRPRHLLHLRERSG